MLHFIQLSDFLKGLKMAIRENPIFSPIAMRFYKAAVGMD